MPVTPLQAVQKAYLALQNGDKHSAHGWAAYAAQAAPDLEEAWLMLAACSTPRASLACLERALQINPASPRARQGLVWARKRLAQETHPQRPPAPLSNPQKRSCGWIGTTLALTVSAVCLLFAFFWFDAARAGSPQPVAAQIWAESALKPPQPASGDFAAPDASPALGAETAASAAPGASELILPLATASQSSVPSATLFFEPPTATPSPIPPTIQATLQTHTVLPDENAAAIAVWYGVEVPALLAANGLQNAGQLQAGLALAIPPAEYVAPPPSYSAEKLILVDISEQHLYAYQAGELIYSFVASTGMGNSTRIGTFEVLEKIPNAYGATWNIWMPNWLGIYWSGHLQNGIHALPILPNGATLWAGYLGTPISYGCVVLDTYESQLLYDWAEVGTKVQIQW